MGKYTVEKKEGQGYVLIKDGEQSFCPLQQPIPAQGIGGVSLMRMPCSTNCPMAKYRDGYYKVDCGGNTVSYKIEEAEEEKPTFSLSAI